ncbi:MAG: tetratricopeptide repeat protein [Chloroflexi bacterium]|nr:tetratricopeptide repeat protein [Chloroflexota bacterium]
MSNPTQTTELLRHGVVAAKAGRTEDARQALLRVVEMDERNEQAWLWLSGVSESFEDRRVCLENVLAINPNNGHAQSGLHWLDQNAPPSLSAAELCPRCQASIPSFDAECSNCGLALVIICPSCGEYVDVQHTACSRCGQILGDFRAGVRYHIELAQAYVGRNRYGLAQQTIARAETEAGDDPLVQSTVAKLYEEMDQIDLAAAAYERAMAQDPENATLYVRLGLIYRRRGMSTKAREMYQQALERADNDPKILFKLAQLQVEENVVTRETLKLLKQVIRLDSKYAPAHLLLSDLYFKQGKRKPALKSCKRACELTMSDSQIGQKARLKLTQLRVSSYDYKQAALASGQLAYSTQRERPGCLTAYASLMGFGAVLQGMGGLVFGVTEMVVDPLTGMGMIMINVVPATLCFLVARGIWNLKNWARIVVVILQGLGFLLNVLFVILVGMAYDPKIHAGYSIQFLCLMLPAIVIGTYMLYWFLASGEYFD